MLRVRIPGADDLVLEHLVLDVNGTLSDRGVMIPGVAEEVASLGAGLRVHVLSADTFGGAEHIAKECEASFRQVGTGQEKVAEIKRLGAGSCAAIGNGRNDAAMLDAAALGIVVVGPEGAHASAVRAADVVTGSIGDALALLADTTALAAVLRP